MNLGIQIVTSDKSESEIPATNISPEDMERLLKLDTNPSIAGTLCAQHFRDQSRSGKI